MSTYLHVCVQLPKDKDLYDLIGTVMLAFVSKHTSVFPNAMLSKHDFWKIAPWKRAMVFVFLARYLTGKDGQKQWKQFSFADYKFNIRLFRKWQR